MSVAVEQLSVTPVGSARPVLNRVSFKAEAGERILLLIGGGLVLLYNTAAILAMLRHYREDRDFMYGLDIKFLDEARAAKRG